MLLPGTRYHSVIRIGFWSVASGGRGVDISYLRKDWLRSGCLPPLTSSSQLSPAIDASSPSLLMIRHHLAIFYRRERLRNPNLCQGLIDPRTLPQ